HFVRSPARAYVAQTTIRCTSVSPRGIWPLYCLTAAPSDRSREHHQPGSQAEHHRRARLWRLAHLIVGYELPVSARTGAACAAADEVLIRGEARVLSEIAKYATPVAQISQDIDDTLHAS